jgi:Trypsin-like peptidase domain
VRRLSCRADFGFELDAAGGGGHVTSLEGAIGTMNGEKGDDWAVIEIDGMQAAWPILALNAAPAPQSGDLAYIIQHPAGQHKRLGYVRNTISDVDDRIVRYLTDTRPGSSGAPVFDAQGRLVALHHAGGRPITVPGKPPLTKNEGIRISRAFARMRAFGLVG